MSKLEFLHGVPVTLVCAYTLDLFVCVQGVHAYVAAHFLLYLGGLSPSAVQHISQTRQTEETPYKS